MERYGWRISSEFGRDFRVSGSAIELNHVVSAPGHLNIRIGRFRAISRAV
jgi:hypothetical protein